MRTTLCLLLICFTVTEGCRNTVSLPELKPINEAIIGNMDSLYMMDVADTLSIFPTIRFTLDTAVSDSSRYRYEWIYVVRPTSGPRYDYRTVSTDKALVNYVISEDILGAAGVYDFTFRVVDIHTDTFTEFPFRVILGNAYYEGWVVLNDVQGRAQVDMVSYHPPSDTFSYLRDVIDFPGDGGGAHSKPVFLDEVFSLKSELVSGGILVGTDRRVTAFSSDGFKRVYDYFQEYSALSNVPDSVKHSSTFRGSVYNQYLYVGGSCYQCYELDYQPGEFRLINRIQTEDGTFRTFRAAPHMAMNNKDLFDVVVLFNEDTDEFVWHGAQEDYCTPLPAANAFDHHLSWSLVYLEYTHIGGGQYVAVLQESVTGDFYYLRFTLYDLLEFSPVPPESGLYRTGHMALDPNTGRFYFGIGKTLFEYSTGGERKVTDFDNEITLLKFKQYLSLIEFMTGATVNKDRYQRYEGMLLVATYDSARPDDSGVFMLYDPIDNRLYQRFDGFAKIVDVTYKER